MQGEVGPPDVSSPNPGMPLDAVPLDDLTFGEGEVARIRRQAADLAEEGTRLAGEADEENEHPAVIAAIECLDLTSLSADDDEGSISELCRRARQPIPGASLRVAAVCVLQRFLPLTRQVLTGSEVKVAVACGDFPTARAALRERTREIEEAVESGADEVDVPIDRALALAEDWHRLYEEIRRYRLSAGEATLKVIVSAAELENLTLIARVALVAAAGGADFVKTSTGKGDDTAELTHGLAMSAAVRRYRRDTGRRLGLKAAGGLRSAADACSWIALVRSELGDDAIDRRHFRLGASGLLEALVEGLHPSALESRP